MHDENDTPKFTWSAEAAPAEAPAQLPVPSDAPPADEPLVITQISPDAERKAYAELLDFLKANANPDTEIETVSVDEFLDGLPANNI